MGWTKLPTFRNGGRWDWTTIPSIDSPAWPPLPIITSDAVRERVQYICVLAVIYHCFQALPDYQLASMVSDLRAICGVDEIAKVAASVFKSPVFRYVAAPHMLDTKHNTTYAFRGMDALAFFGGVKAFTSKPTDNDRKFVKNIRDVVAQFTSNGQIPGWETFPTKTGIQTLSIQLPGVFKPNACRFWRENGMFPEFAWIN